MPRIVPHVVALVSVALVGATPPPPARAPAQTKAPPSDAAPATSLLDEIAGIVDQRFYSASRLNEVGWQPAVGRAREAFARASDAPARATVIRELLATLATSHTAFYPREDPAYWALTSIFEKFLEKTCAKDRVPSLPVTHEDIGVFWKQFSGEWFVGGVFAGGPADVAGLKLGDRVLTADGRPFSPVQAFASRAGKPVTLEIQRERDGSPARVTVTPRTSKPHDELRQATADSSRIIEHRGRRVAYIHLWAWTTFEIQQSLLEAIAKSNIAGVDAFILDIRDGWGGANPHYLGIFFRDVPTLESIARDGKRQPFDNQIRKPAVLLINGGTRSGKEAVAYGVKKHGLARLVGERTAGAVVFGQPFCLSDGSLLLLAVSDARIDGERLEGRGVEPDIEASFDPRYAGGQDAQLERALEVVTNQVAANR